MLVFLWREFGDAVGRTLLVTAIGLLVLAVAMDFCEGLAREHPWNPYQWLTRYPGVGAFMRERFQRPPYDALVHFSKSLEEFVEMLANTLLWAAVLRHWGRIAGDVRIRFAA